MRSQEARLRDILEAIERIEKYAAQGRDAFEQDELIQVWLLYQMVRRHRERHPDSIHASMFDRTILDQILAQPGCAGVRMYYAENADGAQTLVLVGVDAQGNDLADGDIGDNHYPCPPFCGFGSPFMR